MSEDSSRDGQDQFRVIVCQSFVALTFGGVRYHDKCIASDMYMY